MTATTNSDSQPFSAANSRFAPIWKQLKISMCFILLCLPDLTLADVFLEPLHAENTPADLGHSYIHYGKVALLSADNQGDIANIGVLIGQQSIVIIDTGGSSLVAQNLLQAIRHISDLPISHIVVSHAHPDHWMGLPFLLENTRAQLLVNPAFMPALRQRIAEDTAQLNEALDASAALTASNTNFSLENYMDRILAVDKPMTINIGDRKLQLRSLPTSHTNNDLLLWDKLNQTLWVGDMFFVDHIPTFEASIKGLPQSREVIESYNANLIVSGHGRPLPDWPSKWQKQWQYYTTLRHVVSEQIANGLSLQTALATAEQYVKHNDNSPPDTSYGDWQLMETFHPRNVTRTYQALEWD